MQPKLELLSKELTDRILDEAFQLMMNPGIKVQSAAARKLLAGAGAQADETTEVVNEAVRTVPKTFYLFDRQGNCKVTYGGNNVHFDPGSSGVHVLDPETLE